MGKTTVIIDDNLLKAAIEVTKAKSKREVIEKGLRELVHKKNIEALRNELGTFDLSLTLKKLDEIRKAEWMILVDTSAWIFALRKSPLLKLKNRIDHLLEKDDVFILGMIKLELLGGTKTKEEFTRLKSRLDALYEISTDAKLWESAYQLAFDLQRKGFTIPYTDILIASAAIEFKAILLHADLHFDLIAEKTELMVESYVKQV